jgi:hypothetical protein
MKRLIPSLSVWLAIVSLVQIGCSHAPAKPKVLPDDLRAKLGTIGIVSGRYEPNIVLRKPLDKTTGASSTAKSYADSWVRLGGASEGAILMLLTAPIPMAIGAIVGKSKGLSDEKMREVKDAEASIRAAITDLKLQDILRDEFLEIAREQTSFPFVRLEAEGPNSPDERISYRSLSGKGMDSILEIGVTGIDLNGLEAKPDFSLDHMDPLLWISIGVRVRLVRIPYDAEIYTQSFQTRCPGPTFKFMEWGANDAQSLRKEVTGCLSSVRQRILRDLFAPAFDLTGLWGFLNQGCSEYLSSFCQISGRFFVVNIGNLDGPASSVKFYLSETPEFEEGRSTLLKQVPIGAIKVRDFRSISFRHDLNKGQEVRGKYIITVIDAESKMPEPDKANNYVIGTIK